MNDLSSLFFRRALTQTVIKTDVRVIMSIVLASLIVGWFGAVDKLAGKMPIGRLNRIVLNLALGQRAKKQSAVGFCFNSRIEYDYDSRIGFAAY